MNRVKFNEYTGLNVLSAPPQGDSSEYMMWIETGINVEGDQMISTVDIKCVGILSSQIFFGNFTEPFDSISDIRCNISGVSEMLDSPVPSRTITLTFWEVEEYD